MKFRTEIEIAPFTAKIGYENRILALGSCFAQHIAGRLAQAKFRVTANPTGILFNPLSIAAAIESYGTEVLREELCRDGGLWFHYGFHSDFSNTAPEAALERMNAACSAASEALRTADRVLITFGTAWVYERQGAVVANCHKQPAAEFSRRRLSVEEITQTFGRLLKGQLLGKEVILSVSPIRHTGDTLAGNAVSKAVLRLAAENLCENYPNVSYFPAYEILTDDLRDYRFYADDLVHPAPQAVEYVWEKFSESVLSDQARGLLPEVMLIVRAAEHRPRDPHSEAHKRFCEGMLARIAALPELDFSRENAYFRRCIEINS